MQRWVYPQPEPVQPPPYSLISCREYPPFDFRENLKNEGGSRIFHAVERHTQFPQPRHLIAWQSWDTLYERHQLVPSHYWHYKRVASEIGDTRHLPYLKDVLAHAMSQAEPNDIIAWTNDDNILHPEFPNYLRYHVEKFGPCTAFRSEFHNNIPSLGLPPDVFDKGASFEHPGRDLFAAKKAWFEKRWDEIPDFILGCSMFDSCLAMLVRKEHGLSPNYKATLSGVLHPAEIPRGYIAHIFHESHWIRSDYEKTAPGQRHNAILFQEWEKKNAQPS